MINQLRTLYCRHFTDVSSIVDLRPTIYHGAISRAFLQITLQVLQVKKYFFRAANKLVAIE